MNEEEKYEAMETLSRLGCKGIAATTHRKEGTIYFEVKAYFRKRNPPRWEYLYFHTFTEVRKFTNTVLTEWWGNGQEKKKED